MRGKIREGGADTLIFEPSHWCPLPFHFTMQQVAFAATKGRKDEAPIPIKEFGHVHSLMGCFIWHFPRQIANFF